jgi:hypothetical protein
MVNTYRYLSGSERPESYNDEKEKIQYVNYCYAKQKDFKTSIPKEKRARR